MFPAGFEDEDDDYHPPNDYYYDEDDYHYHPQGFDDLYDVLHFEDHERFLFDFDLKWEELKVSVSDVLQLSAMTTKLIEALEIRKGSASEELKSLFR